MSSTSRIDIRLLEEEKQQAKIQASKLGMDLSGYIKHIIYLDIATGIVEKLREENKINTGCNTNELLYLIDTAIKLINHGIKEIKDYDILIKMQSYLNDKITGRETQKPNISFYMNGSDFI